MSTRLSLGAAFLLGTSTLAATALIPTIAQAQVTASSVNGVVRTNTGLPVADANVTITYLPTGRVDRATTSANGTFFETGLLVGGPYTISITSAEGNLLRENVRLLPSTNSFQLVVSGLQDEVVVTGTRVDTTDIGDGLGSAFSNEEIIGQPSATRDLIATLVRDPLANSTGVGILSIAGANPRFNALSIDGSLQQADFGLGQSTYATRRSPISLDVIESATVVATDYSVTQSGFTGGLVNVVTKSGTNEFDGVLYFYKQNEDFFGDETENDEGERVTVPVIPFDEEEYGFVLRGPIVKDKLFFLASYDEFKSASGAEFSQNDRNTGLDPAIFPALANIVQTGLGYDIGERPLSLSNPVKSERMLGKIDWNINDFHRAAFTYQNTQEDQVNNVGSRTFSTAYYDSPSELTAYSGQLFSDWTEDFSTELRVNYKEFDQEQNCRAGSGVGAVTIELSTADLVGTSLEGFIEDTAGEVEFEGGCDEFRQGNTFSDERLQIQGVGRLTADDHLLTFGAEFQNYQLANLFAQNSVGTFFFDSIDGLQNGIAQTASVRLPQSGNRADTLAEWGYDQIALFLQDSWQVTPNLRVDGGVRYERIMQDDIPAERTFVQQLYGIPNTLNLDGNDLVMPRFSFEWNALDRTTLTGGFGVYGGGDPKVWTSNAFTPPVFFSRLNNFAVGSPADGTPQALIDLATANDANDPGPIDIIAPNFKTPSDLKASLRLDQGFNLNFGDFNLGDDYTFSAQVLYTDSQNGFGWQNIAQIRNPEALPTGTAPDGRPIYADLDALRLNNVIALTNVDQGESWVYTASLAKDWDFGLSGYISYAYQDIESATPGSSSRGISNFRGTQDINRNFPVPGRAVYETEHAFKVGLTFQRDLIAGLESRFSLFGNITSGEPFSYTFDVDRSNALFGRSGDRESPRDNDLLYIPAISGGAINDPNVVVASGFNQADFIDFVNREGLSAGLQDKNEGNSTWNQQWDFQWQQEIPFFNKQAEKFLGENKLKFVLDINNIANLLNSDWGTQYNGPRFDANGVVRADLVSATDVAANGVDGATALEGDAPRTTCINAGDCVYRYNSFRDRDANFQQLFRSVYEIRAGIRYEF
ncbi:TonB-dependent receptor [uncultured Algimonas sp.]|uniref:TonB-dependent receptor n=1 Tax=uncultured Algimonas sp. TaxID=1547920 RepID=UPI00262C6745|nr:TonB-dependent receptor [uncultured Algimonas sp.]